MKKISDNRFLTASAIILAAALSRMIPHPPNFTPLVAIALFGGATLLNKKFAFAVPLLSMLVTDLLLGFHNTMPAVYLSFIATVMIGIYIGKNLTVVKTVTGTIAASVLFFVVTNLSVWLMSGMYPLNLSGLTLCFEAAIPFYRNSFIGDIIYSTVLFGGFALVTRFMHQSETSVN